MRTFHPSKGWGGQLGRGWDLRTKNYSLAFFHCGKQKPPVPTKAVLSPEHPFHSSMEVAPLSFLTLPSSPQPWTHRPHTSPEKVGATVSAGQAASSLA